MRGYVVVPTDIDGPKSARRIDPGDLQSVPRATDSMSRTPPPSKRPSPRSWPSTPCHRSGSPTPASLV